MRQSRAAWQGSCCYTHIPTYSYLSCSSTQVLWRSSMSPPLPRLLFTQVHYVEQAHSAARLTAMLASSAPPPPQAGVPEDTGPTSGDDEEEEESDDEVEDSADAMVQDLVAGGPRAGGDARQAPIGRVSLPVRTRALCSW